MATLYITEFTTVATRISAAPIAQSPPLAEQTVAIGVSSTQSGGFNAGTRFIRVHTDAICSVAVGSNPTATAVKMRMPADAIEYFGVTAGDKIAVITNT